MTSLPTTPMNPDHSICQRIQIYESESRFGQIKYGLNSKKDKDIDMYPICKLEQKNKTQC